MRWLTLFSFALLSVVLLLPGYAIASDADVGAMESITLERTPCYGRCPIYNVEMTRKGRVTFFGENFVAARGRRVSHIEEAQFVDIESQFKRINFLNLRSSYAEYSDGCKEVWTDNPGLRIKAKYKNGGKEVAYYFGCKGIPVLADIERLGEAIDAAAGTSKWINKP